MQKSLYEQIYEKYKRYILLGVYEEGEKLPSIREIASLHGVNPNTVNRSFMMLEEEGLIETIFKKGSFVKKQHEDKESEILKKEIKKYKELGISKVKILKIIKEVYGDTND